MRGLWDPLPVWQSIVKLPEFLLTKLPGKFLARRAQEWNTGFFDASTVAQPDPRDGIHLDAANTRAIGEGLVPVVKSMLGL